MLVDLKGEPIFTAETIEHCWISFEGFQQGNQFSCIGGK